MTIYDLEDGYVRIVPDDKYILLNIVSNRRYSEAVVEEKNMHNYKAIEITKE